MLILIPASRDTHIGQCSPHQEKWGDLPEHLRDSVGNGYAITIGATSTAFLHGDLESIHNVLTRAMDRTLRLWTDPTHQPGEAPAPQAIPTPDPAHVARWSQWLQTPEAQELAPDISITEFHRTDPRFWPGIANLLAAAQTGATQGHEVPALLPPAAKAVTIAPLASGEAICLIAMHSGIRIATKPVTRWQLTPSEGGVHAAAEALTVIAAEVRAATRTPLTAIEAAA